ncbi:MAG: hypothetical protein ACRECF_08945 [Methyloceanibacter sp.]
MKHLTDEERAEITTKIFMLFDRGSDLAMMADIVVVLATTLGMAIALTKHEVDVDSDDLLDKAVDRVRAAYDHAMEDPEFGRTVIIGQLQ